MIYGIRAYKRWLSPLLPPACRFHPTCSVYALECLRLYPTGKASWLILRRLSRCQPFCAGGHDPVPRPGSQAKAAFQQRTPHFYG